MPPLSLKARVAFFITKISSGYRSGSVRMMLLRPESAARIGLIPEELSDRVTVLGNAAGSGALRYATEEGAAESALGIIRRTRYIELSAHAGFTDAYVERMLFPERE